MAVGDIVESIFRQDAFGQEALNVFQYRITQEDTPFDYNDVAEELYQFYRDTFRLIQVAGIVYQEVIVNNITDGISFGTFVGAESSLIGGTNFAAFAAYSFKYNRATKVTRPGGKRITGVIRERVANSAPNVALLADCQAVAVDLSAPIELRDVPAGPITGVLTPVIVGRAPVSGGYDLSRVNDVTSVEFTGISTQNSRKVGQGS